MIRKNRIRKHMIIFRGCSIALICYSLIACSDPNEANENNFQTTLEQFYNNNPKYTKICFLGAYKYPKEVVHHVTYASAEMSLEAAGLVKRIKVREGQYAGVYKVNYITYDLTPKGKELYINQKFCYQGNYSVDVTNFTVPQSNNGVSVSRVDYVTKITGAPDWAVQVANELKKIEGEAHHRDFYEAANAIPENKSAIIILTNKGWQVDRVIEKSILNKMFR